MTRAAAGLGGFKFERMTDDILNLMPVRNGHFILESGYHADIWFNLDSLFISPRRTAPLVTELAQEFF